MKVLEYRYYQESTCGLDFEGMIDDLRAAEPGAAVVLHACGHNPTGVDPTPAQWQAIADVCKQQQLVPIFDAAYLVCGGCVVVGAFFT